MTVFEFDTDRHGRTEGLTRRMARWVSDTLRNIQLRAAERRRDHLNRQAFKTLLGKEDWVYRDMGISRADVEWAAQLPAHINAARELERIRDRARMGR